MKSESDKETRRRIHARRLPLYEEKSQDSILARTEAISELNNDGSMLSVQIITDFGNTNTPNMENVIQTQDYWA